MPTALVKVTYALEDNAAGVLDDESYFPTADVVIQVEADNMSAALNVAWQQQADVVGQHRTLTAEFLNWM